MTAVVTATTRTALTSAHGDIQKWIRERLDRVTVELQAARAGFATAKERGHGTEAIARQLRRIEKHEAFLTKTLAAIAAGYTIVPNFNIEQIAVRTDKGTPSSTRTSTPTIGAARLPVGRGDFVAPEPEYISWEVETERPDKTKRTVRMYQATEHAPVDIPFVLVKKDLADALDTALREKLFDEIGIVRDTPRGDPVLVGRIRHPNAGRASWDNRGVTFFIGWWFDVRTLDL